MNPSRIALTLVALATLILSSGCVTKASARAQAQRAYLAGTQDAIARLGGAREPIITFSGQVQRQTIPWTPDLTLANAIIAAGYSANTDPERIVIHRQTQQIHIDPNDLLAGKDFILQPGDLIILGDNL